MYSLSFLLFGVTLWYALDEIRNSGVLTKGSPLAWSEIVLYTFAAGKTLGEVRHRKPVRDTRVFVTGRAVLRTVDT